MTEKNRSDIHPLQGVGDLCFGMASSEAREIVGEPRYSGTTPQHELHEDYGHMALTYADGHLVEVALSFEAGARFNDVELFRTPDAAQLLVQLQGPGAPVLEGLGFTVFPALGIALADFNSEQTSDRTVIAFARGRWDDKKHLHSIDPEALRMPSSE